MYKKILVSKKCVGCGSCFSISTLVLENENGNAISNVEVGINTRNELEAEEIVNICPVGAISIVNRGITKKEGEAGIKEIKKKAINLLENYEDIDIPWLDEVKFYENENSIPIPSAKGEYDYNYSSSGQAESAAKNEFNRIMYSQIDVIIQRLVMEYKVKYIKPYYTCKNEESSYYVRFNRKIVEMLKNIATEINVISNGTINLPDSFTKFNIFPDYSRYSLAQMMENNEIFNAEIVKNIRSEFDKESYHKIEAYNNWDINEWREYIGTGFFGDKYKYRYRYADMYKACCKLAKDILFTIRISDIDESARYRVGELIKEYNRNVKSELKKRIEILNEKL